VPFLADKGLLWGAAPDRLWVVDPSTGKVVRRIPLPDSTEVLSLGLGFGSVWVTDSGSGSLYRISPEA
jgi:streptogramin lyase